MRRFSLLLAAALFAGLPGVGAAAPGQGAASSPRFKLTLTRPMLASGHVRLEPGDYDVTFEASPRGMPHVTAVFSRGGVRVATSPAELKGAPAGSKLSEVAMDDWIGASLNYKYARKDGSINPAHFDVKVKSQRAFVEALLTEIGMPESDGSSKAPATVTTSPPKPTPTKR